MARPGRPIICRVDLLAGRRAYPARLIVASLVLPVLLLAALIALDFWILEPAMPSGLAHLALLGEDATAEAGKKLPQGRQSFR